MVRDEARDIAEWIAYHALAGVDSFLIYDNGSSDGTAAVLKSAASLYDVRLTPWRTPSVLAQLEAYRHALRTNRREFDWIAVIDSDEFIVVHHPRTLRDLCDTPAAAVAINWAMFGSNGHSQLPTCLVTEAFTRRAEARFGPNRHVKTMLRPALFQDCINPHAFLVDGDSTVPDRRPLQWWTDQNGNVNPGLTYTAPNHSIAQINHYFTRSRAHWSLKAARGYRNPFSMSKLTQFDAYDRNEIKDTSALWAVDEVRRRRNEILARALSHPAGPAEAKRIWQMLCQVDAMA